jgi:hypothetical protein
MDTFPITIQENNNLTRTNRPVRLGIPFPRSKLKDLQQLELINEAGEQLHFQSKITAHWDDQSFRWILIDFLTSIKANQTIQYQLNITSNSRKTNTNKTLGYSENKQEIIVTTGIASFHIDKHNFTPFNKIVTPLSDRVMNGSKTSLVDDSGELLVATIEKIRYPQQDQDQRLTLEFEGVFKKSKTPFLNFKSSLTFFVGSALCELDFTLHNPDRAIHPGGFWDMGDPGSKYFKSLAISLGLPENTETFWKNLEETNFSKLEGEKIRLYQDSSGGENWKHHIHINKEGDSTVKFKGYQLTSDNKTIKEGLRAAPIFQMKTDRGHIQATINKFWQNFPKALSHDEGNLNIELFPITMVEGLHELQGGEKKTHTVLLNFSDQTDAVAEYLTDLNISLPQKYYHQTDAMPWIPESHQPDPLDTIIQEGLTGEDCFFSKREKSDEYGWRNFGELWADHETLEHGTDNSLVSHFNNQYDPIYGFARQYLLTGDKHWFELMDDLAKHVIDIDIYDTENDRPEYNHGLFWHTDHYLDGRHCTHRTHSKQHMAIDHVEQSGGGPGAQHCYSTGLLFHYLLTGERRSHEKVVNLYQWVDGAMEGTGGVLEYLKAALDKFKQAIKCDPQKRDLLIHRYPFTRGTGNYINTILDNYLITTDIDILKKADKVICGTFSCHDDIGARELDNIEKTWSYLIFLQAVFRYVYLSPPDHQVSIEVIAGLYHYCEWMAKNEEPYLDQKEILVYPNSTWPAQDLRKVMIFQVAEQMFPDNNKIYSKKKGKIQNHIEKELSSLDILKSTRILSILMQNKISIDTSSKLSDERHFNKEKMLELIQRIDKQCFSLTSFAKEFLIELSKRTLKIRIRKEYRWLKFRFM